MATIPVEKPAPGFVLAAEINHDEMQRERTHREIEAAQTQRGQPEDDSEEGTHQCCRRQGDPEWRVGLAKQNSDRERARRHQAGVSSEIRPA